MQRRSVEWIHLLLSYSKWRKKDSPLSRIMDLTGSTECRIRMKVTFWRKDRLLNQDANVRCQLRLSIFDLSP